MKDLIDRQTLLAQMEAQEQAFEKEMQENGTTDLVQPSWHLAKDMIAEMAREGADDKG